MAFPPPGPTFPVVYYSKNLRVIPVVVHSQEEADRLNPNEWETVPPADSGPLSEDPYPKLFYDVNLSPVVVGSAEEEKTLDPSRYREFAFTEALVKAAGAKLDRAKAKAQ